MKPGPLPPADRPADAATEETNRPAERVAPSEAWPDLFDQVAVGLAQVGLGGEWLRVNPRLCEIVGYRPQELLQRTFSDLTYPEDLAADWQQAHALLRGEIRTYSIEKRYRRKDGQLVWVQLTVSLMRDAAGVPQYFLSVIEDINARKQMEAELNASEDWFRTLFEASPVAKYLIDPADGSLLAFNEQAARQLGYTREELARLRITDIDAGSSSEGRHTEALRNREGAKSTFPTRHRTKNGEFREVVVTSEIILFGGRQVLYASALDLTERQRAERALRESEERYRYTLTLTPLVPWEADPIGHIIYFSPRWLTLTGLTHEQALGEGWQQVAHPDDLPAMVAAWQHSVQTGEPYDIEHRVRTATGEYRWMHSRAYPRRDERGHVVRWYGTTEDIDARKRAEQQIQELNATLERRVEERTRELAEVNRELEAFSYSVSHDLRAPLRSIDGFGKILLRDYPGQVLDERAVGYLRRISAATVRMGQLIEDLLNLSRVSRMELKRQRVDLSALARSILRDLEEREPERPVTLSVPEGLGAWGDPQLLRIALTNLLGNAWKFTSKTAQPRIEVFASQTNSEPVYHVRDNGAGFSMAHVGHLFVPFQRLHRADEFEGTGIGLAIVQRIIHRHGGRVWAEGEPGLGATVSFTLGETGT